MSSVEKKSSFKRTGCSVSFSLYIKADREGRALDIIADLEHDIDCLMTAARVAVDRSWKGGPAVESEERAKTTLNAGLALPNGHKGEQ